MKTEKARNLKKDRGLSDSRATGFPGGDPAGSGAGVPGKTNSTQSRSLTWLALHVLFLSLLFRVSLLASVHHDENTTVSRDSFNFASALFWI